MAHEGVDRTVFMFGFVKGYARSAMNYSNITQHPLRHVIERRVKIISFYDRHGAAATKEAFDVSRSTVFLWKKTLREHHGRLVALAPASRAPKRRRQRLIDPRIVSFIVAQRSRHPRLSKDKLAVLLQPYCASLAIDSPSASTVGRLLSDLKRQGKLPVGAKLSLHGATGKLKEQKRRAKLKKQRRAGYQPKEPGDMLQLDTIVKFINGMRRYVITAVDYQARFGFAYGYTSPSSANAADFLAKLQAVAPFAIRRVHHDNGSEFYKHFVAACERTNVVQLWNWPKKPQLNGMVERFNRTIQDEFVDGHLDELAYDLDSFNTELMDWLVWYNTERPHYSLSLKSPMQHILELLQLSTRESNMLWTDTLIMVSMSTTDKTTIYLSPSVKKALKKRIVDTNQTMSEYIDRALAQALTQDIADVEAIAARRSEPSESLDEFMAGLRADGLL
jgi:putative transposase